MEIWGEGLLWSDKWTEKQTQKGQNMKRPSLFFPQFLFCFNHMCAVIYFNDYCSFKGSFYPHHFAPTS